MSSIWCRKSRIVLRRSLLLLSFVLAGTAFAYDGLTLGLAGGATAWPPTLDARVVYPLLAFGADDAPVGVALRGDLSYAPDGAGLPALGVSALLTGRPEGGLDWERYLGIGGGVGFPPAPLVAPLFTAHLLAGVRAPLGGPLLGVAEVQIAGGSLSLLAPALSVGLEVGLGGAR